jgi:hypothetical protein
MLTQYEINKIIEALGHAERNSHASNKQAWRDVAEKAKAELPLLLPSSGGSCQCEDRPCCSCDSDTYLTPYNTEEDPGDVADRWRERQEMADLLDEDQCYYCHQQIESDNEDELMNGFHDLCGETRGE